VDRTDWTWDSSLFAGSAPHYVTGRMPYPPELATAISEMAGSGRLLDVGCGPGSLTVLLAPLFDAAVGVDADPHMIELARSRAPSVEWHCLRAEDLPAGLGRFDVVTFAQSFHWMDQPLVAARVRDMLTPGGAWVHVGATTHRGVNDDGPPWARIDALVAAYLGPVRRAGQSTLSGGTRSGEEDVMRAAGWSGPQRRVVERGETVTRSVDEVVSAVLSLSSSAPHLFGGELPRFVADLRNLLSEAAPDGVFSERLREIEVVVWRL
jgi:SAM-dependent methyltransferase